MKPTVLVLAGAAAAALVLTAGAVVGALQDPAVRDCAAAIDAAGVANTAHQDALEVLARELDRRVINGPVAQRARAEVDQTARALVAARDDFTRRCRYQR